MLLWRAKAASTLGADASGMVVPLRRRLAMIPDGCQGRINSAFRFGTTLLYLLRAWLCGVLSALVDTGVAVFPTLMVLVATAAARNPLIRRAGLAPA